MYHCWTSTMATPRRAGKWLIAALATAPTLPLLSLFSTSPAALSSADAPTPHSDSAGSRKAVKEPFTGIEFDWSKTADGVDEHNSYRLLGTAVRCMLGQCKFAKARAYAVGLYVEDGKQGSLLANTVEEIAPHDSLGAAVLAAPVGRNLLLVMDRDVAGHHIGKGFDRSLLPRIRKAQGGAKTGPGKDALRDFTRCFNNEKMIRKGTRISLLWRPDDTLVVSIDSRVRAVISSPVLCRAVFDVYLAPDSIFNKYHNTAFVYHKDQSEE